MDVTPESVSAYLNKDQSALYSLIWKRFVASQMRPALLDQTQAEIEAGPALFKATGSVMVFKGYTAVYEEGPLDSGAEKESDKRLPPLKEGQTLDLEKLEPAQHFTQPPPRYTEATLIKALEANGIGRPSTYASILGNINGREYVTQEERRFRPTELGLMITDLLVKGFPDIMDTAFTAQMESSLDKVEKGDIPWGRVIQSFYEPFEKSLKRAREEMKGEVPTDARCPQCDRTLVIKSGKNGLFLACTGYPQCKYTANFVRDEKGKIIPESGKGDEKMVGTCEECGKPMVLKNGRFGPFVACSGYPLCKNTGPRPMVKTHVKCPEKDCPGSIVEKSSKKGKRFYSCDQYPRCRFALWNEPVEDTCPQCGTPVMILKQSKGGSPFVACRKEGCRFKKSVSLENEMGQRAEKEPRPSP